MLSEELLSLASAAAKTIVSAAAGDAWATVKQAFARLLGRGNQELAEATARRLDETRRELAAVREPDLEAARTRLVAAWQIRLSDLLAEAPDLAAALRALTSQLQDDLPAGPVSAREHGLAAGRDIGIAASGGAVAAGTIQGNFLTGNPTRPGPAS